MPTPHASPLDPAARRRHKLRNLGQSALLIGGMVGLLSLCAWTVAGPEGVVWTLIGGALALVLSPSVSPRLVLTMFGARPLAPESFPEGYALLGELARRAGLARLPRLYHLPSAAANAFAVGGRDNAAIAITDGMLRSLNLRELAGVLAHELSHIRNNDLWVMNLADTISRLTRLMSFAGVVLLFVSLPLLVARGVGVPWLLILALLLAPTIGSLLQLALARAREFDADLDAAGLTGDPLGLASALEKLERVHGRGWERILLAGRRIPEPSLLRTHPPTDERVRRLASLTRAPEAAPMRPPEPVPVPRHVVRVMRPPRWHWSGTWY